MCVRALLKQLKCLGEMDGWTMETDMRKTKYKKKERELNERRLLQTNDIFTYPA